MRFVPSTRAGQISCAFGAAFVALFAFVQLLVASGREDSALRPVSATLTLAAALAAGATAVVAVRRGERAVPVLAAILVGALALLFVAAEIVGND